MAYFTPVEPRHTADELRTALKRSRDEGQKTRLRAIILATENKQRQEIVERLQVSDHSVTNWVQTYNEGGIEALKTNTGGRPKGTTKWSSDIFRALTKEIDTTGGYWSIPRMRDWIMKTYGMDIPPVTVWYRVADLDYSYKSARPHPAKGDPEAQERFKKGASSRHSKR